MDCDVSHASATNPSGCLNDLFPWVEITIGAGTNGAPLTPGGITPSGEGSVSMGIYNVAQGDMPYFKQLSDSYTTSDNYHQPAKGGTGLDSIMAGFGDAIYYTDGRGNAPLRPSGRLKIPTPRVARTTSTPTMDMVTPRPGREAHTAIVPMPVSPG